jgi:hypothetical protein
MDKRVLNRRFRMETSAVFLVVASIAVACFQFRRMQPFNAQIAGFYSGYILVSAVLGYHLAGWYTAPDTSWFETVSVPIVIALLASVGACLLWLTLDAIAGRVSDLYEGVLAAMLLVMKLLVTSGLSTVMIGICASIALRFRARVIACAEPNKTMEPTR